MTIGIPGPHFDDTNFRLDFGKEGCAGRCGATVVPDLEDIGLEIRSAIDNTAFGIGIGVTHEQEVNASVGHLQDNGVLVDVIRKSGGWVEDRDGQAGV